MKYNFLRVLFILSVLYSNSYCYFSGRNAFRYGAHYPDGNNTFVYMTGPSGTYREMTDLSYVYNYYSQFNSTNHPYDRNALLAYANGQHMTTCPNSAGHLLWDLNHDGELDQVSSYGFGFFDNNGGRFIGDGSGSSNAFTNFWFDDNWLANYVVMAYENATQLPSGLTRYPQSAPKYQVLEGDSSDWTPYNTSSTYDTMILNALYYLSRNEVTTAFSLWQSIMSTASSAYDQNNQQYYYPSMSGSSAYQLGLLKILTELLALSRNDTSGSLTQHSVSLRSAILTRIQASSGSSVINTATMSLWTLGLGAGAYSNYEAGTMLKYAESASYFMRPYHALSAVKDSGSQPGYISYGPYVSFPVGTYAVDFFLRTHLPPNDGSQIVTIEVHNSITDEILSQVDITSGFINDQWVMMSTNFTSTDPSDKYEFRAYWHGKCNTDISYVRVRPSASQSLSTTGVSNPASSTSNDGATSTSGATATSGTVTTPETSSTGVAGSTTGDASTSETISSTSTNQGQFTTTDASVSTEGTKVVSDDHSSSSQDLGLILGLSIGIGGTIIVIIIIASIALIFVTLKKRRSLSKYPVEVPRGISTNFEGDAEVCLPAIMPIQKSDSKTSVTSTGSFSSIEDQKYFSFPVVTAPRKYSQSSDGSSSNRTNYVTTDYDNLPSFPDEAKEHSLEKLNPAWIISRDDISSDQQEIGRGTFGVVYKAEWRKTPVAIKNLKSDALTEKELENFRKEIKLMMSLRPHANVVQFYGIVKNPLGTVCEYLGNGSLLQLLKSDAVLSSDRKISIIAGIARGMFHLQEEKIVHRDLAARNVLMSSNFEPKISDFGLSRQVASDDNTTQDATGPLKWMAPESIKRRKYSFKSDVWSFGITVIEVLTRETPYKGLEGVQVALSVVNDKAKPHVPTDIPPELHTLLISCFEFEPALRPDFGKICDILSGITINSSSSNYELSKSLRKK